MDPGILVPPKGYGGHERLVYMFAKEYAQLGHEVHLLVTSGSSVDGCTVHGYGKEGFPPKKLDALLAVPKAWWFLWKNRNSFDLVHNFGRLLYMLPILNYSSSKIMTYGRIIDGRNIRIVNKIPHKNLVFTAPSNWCVSTGNNSGRWETVNNAIDFSKYNLRENLSADAPLIFLSRIERLKGAHEAIQIAQSLGEKLIIAGNISPLPEEQSYFHKEIEPYIDGSQITYVGTLDDEDKNYYLGLSKAMLFPARTEEAFGMVMIESMACGTPVIAYNHSALPEVVTDGKTGYIVQNIEGMISKVKDLTAIDRRKCREYALQKFDVKIIASKYLNLFK
jgi:glycosyltransferase involved in cell wall biosynthesis